MQEEQVPLQQIQPQQNEQQQQAPMPGAVEAAPGQREASESGSYSVSGSGSSSYSSSESEFDDSPRENRVLTFADEHGDMLCEYGFYGINAPNPNIAVKEGSTDPVANVQKKGGCCVIS